MDILLVKRLYVAEIYWTSTICLLSELLGKVSLTSALPSELDVQFVFDAHLIQVTASRVDLRREPCRSKDRLFCNVSIPAILVLFGSFELELVLQL